MNRPEENMVVTLRKLPSVGLGRFQTAMVAGSVLLASLLAAFVILKFGTASFFLVLASILILPVVFLIIAFPEAGILFLLTCAYLIMFLERFTNGFPLGTMMDAMVSLLIIGFFLKQKYANDWSLFKNTISKVVVVWICYNLLEVLNPAAESRLAWLYAVRPIAFVTLTYFIFQFYIRDIKFIRTIMKLWIFLSVIGALYALKQEYFGFADFEWHILKSDPIITRLYFIGNHWRKFSIFSDPVAFAYNMVISSILCFCLATGKLALWKKIVLNLQGALFFFAMLYSGTRGAYVLFPVAYVFFSILKYNKKIVLMSIIVFCVAAFLIFVPTSNYTLYRFQTAFKPNKDASFNLRKTNQKRIQPYIQSHPLGGGVGSTGVWGQRFSANSYLASFPPDSGYVRIAVELGWVGLFIFCTLMFVVLKTGVTNYFAIEDPELKSVCLAMLLIVFSLNIGNYPQEAIVQYPINIYFYLAIALLTITLKLDRQIKHDIDTNNIKNKYL
jgi:putative inorganic carbon (HCO3(-)) transporter